MKSRLVYSVDVVQSKIPQCSASDVSGRSHSTDKTPAPLRMTLWTLIASVAIALYLVIGLLLISTRPGLQGDEAFLLQGVIRILNGEELIQFMASPYHGSAKTYLVLPVFLITGIDVEWARVVNLGLGLAGLLGAVAFARGQFGAPAGAMTGIMIAVHPGYAGAVVFDSTGLPLLFSIFGLLLLGLDRLLRIGDWRAAFLVGLSIGLGGWTRANFVWPAAALAIALLVIRAPVMQQWRRLVPPLVAGGLLGGLPLIAYQIQSRGGTLKYMAGGSMTESLIHLIEPRLRSAYSVLFYDAHRRYIWGADRDPTIETAVCAAVLAVALVLNLLNVPRAGSEGERRTRRLLAVWLVLSLAFMFTTRMPLGPHHFLSYLPIAVLLVASCCAGIWVTTRASKAIVVAAGLAYVLTSLVWISMTVEALRRNRGIDYWSDAIYGVAAEVESRRMGRAVKVADWGPGFNLRVLLGGRVETIELFWHQSPVRTDRGTTWDEEVKEGGLFIATHDDIPHDPVTSHALRRAVESSGKDTRGSSCASETAKAMRISTMFPRAPPQEVDVFASDLGHPAFEILTCPAPLTILTGLGCSVSLKLSQ